MIQNMNSTPNFWDKSHPLSEHYQKLVSDLLPDYGYAETLQGELIRAVSRIGYDWYNNGWGCNNWSGAVIFLQEKFSELPIQLQDINAIANFHAALDRVHEYSHGEPVRTPDVKIEKWVTTIIEVVTQAILDNPKPIDNTDDMFNYQEKPYHEAYWS